MAVRFEYTPPKVNGILAVNAAGAAAVKAGAEIILEASRPQVPRDTGEMQASGKVTSEGLVAAISYTRYSPEGYNVAARQHEDLTLNHPRGGNAKFLEGPMHSEAPAVAAAIVVSLRKMFL